MQKTIAVFFTATFCVLLLAACSGGKTFKDGVYHAEFETYDSRGYKDFIDVTVQDAKVTTISYDARAEDGSLRTGDAKYQKDMEAVQETYPARYSQDLVNQYLEDQNIDGVDTVAGATYSTESFIALFKALEPNMVSGNTDPLTLPNIPEK